MRRTKSVIVLTMLAGAMLIVSTCAKREPVEEGQSKLKFKSVSNQDDVLVGLSAQYLYGTKDKPSELKDLPKGLTAVYACFLAELAGRSTPAVLDSYGKPERSRLYVDTNGDGCLSNEKSYRPKIIKHSKHIATEYKFGPIVMKSRGVEGELVTRFYATAYGTRLAFFPAGYQIGKVGLGKNTYTVAVVDGNLDGRYDKVFSLPLRDPYCPGCDLFVIDLNRNGKKWHYSLSGPSEVMPLARMLKLKNTYYGIDVAPDGTSIAFKKVQPEFGTLDVGGANVKLKLWSDAAEQYLFGSEESWQIPPGTYSARFIELNEIDSERNAWTFRSYSDAGSLHDFEIRTGQTTSFKIGPPFSIKTEAKQVADRVSIGLKLEGCAGERYSLPVMKGGKRLPAPTFKIFSESGKVLVPGQFEYG